VLSQTTTLAAAHDGAAHRCAAVVGARSAKTRPSTTFPEFLGGS
jgi:hypothetical protein